MIWLINAVPAFCQQKEISIGDTLPDVVIRGILNRQLDNVRLRNLHNNKLLIVDFWGTFCIPCISEMKFLDSLSAKHPDQFSVVMVTAEDSLTVKKFLARPNNKDIHTSNLLLATNDTLLHQFFKHRSVPHNVWIDKNGIVRAITQGNQVTKENILNFDSSNVAKTLKVKKDNMTFNVLEDFTLGNPVYTYRSIITPFIRGIGGGSTHKSMSGKTMSSFYYNTTILHHFWAAYSHFNPQLRENLIELYTADSLKFFFPSKNRKHLLQGSKYKDMEEWKEENTFCYALKLPQFVPDTVFRDYMFNDLERQFPGVKATIRNRNIPCTVVTRTENKHIDQSDCNNNPQPVIYIKGRSLFIKNSRIKDVLNYIFVTFGSKLVPDPFVTELGPREDECFNAELRFEEERAKSGIYPEMVLEELRKLGYHFEKQVRPYPILVIRDLGI
ncbi:thiol-disulfide isomerase/thioredoxin [Pedobacter sp. AK017]|uniref:TlpA family protein disulfide reductase n=1 Tax=Pedobacter sp. AK017 TaxID=2723073 RepID=UPI001610D0EA|nr:TlpA disulfide reductase family protein [Pedobacter sp. AK017]MBB5440616.1 thiol-disulfide isomerase/thioredoxin [Pedobacter sp. AK017]